MDQLVVASTQFSKVEGVYGSFLNLRVTTDTGETYEIVGIGDQKKEQICKGSILRGESFKKNGYTKFKVSDYTIPEHRPGSKTAVKNDLEKVRDKLQEALMLLEQM